MGNQFTASSTRQELKTRLAESLIDDDDLGALVAFLRDDLAFAPDNGSIVGSVLHEDEFDAWRDLMTAVQWNTPWPIDYDTSEVRTLSRNLLTKMGLS